ncbi:MAG: helix-turn-helix domain-containing protein [Prevotellaceae bacterium]|jgi:tRNA uridine 5-carbamoylmethylation protein Kti12|nr:helix-turn-helix domain-containing protein [Prevotellaceae bacterium]
MQSNAQLQLAFDFVQYTGEHIFLTGKAGTGKTTFLKNLKERSPKRMIVVAPTGVAAINAGGVTIHSFFQLSFAPQVGEQKNPNEQMRFAREKINIIRSLNLLVIDEISMVRADLLDAIDKVLRRFRDRSKPFGGVQLLMIGDLQQLAPVVKDDERALLRSHYDTVYFFSSQALRETSFVSIELTHVFRQQDDSFIALLNRVRENRLDAASLEALNRRYIPNFAPKDDEGYITLCTHNAQAQRINDNKLQKLPAKEKKFTATITGNFPEYSYPTEYDLHLKTGAQVMFVKNDPSREKLFFNGKIGKITRMDDDEIVVQCPDDDNEIIVTPLVWENIKYTIDQTTGEISETVEGSFTQFPLKLAWAITIHKSQGLTFERAIIDAEASFAHGQVYVALSRCKTLEGMVLSSPIGNRSIISDNTVSSFIRHIEQNPPDEERLNQARLTFQHELLADLFRFNRIRSLVGGINRIIDDNSGSLLQPLKDAFRRIWTAMQNDLLAVAEKFHAQIATLLITQADVEQNEALQERIGKAAGYFGEKIKTVINEELMRVDLDIDNKSLRKQLNDAVARLEDELRVKRLCLAACERGFAVKLLLDTRAIAVLEKSKVKDVAKYAETKNLEHNIEHQELFNMLRSWRSAKADELNVENYMIFSQKSLYEMVEYLPQSGEDLKRINGMGNKKVSQFGADIIEIIADYCERKGITPPQHIPLKKKSTEAKKPKENTKDISFELYKQGKTITEIAAERGMIASTIEGHLAHFVSTGDLAVSLFVGDEKLRRISDYFHTAGSRSLSPAREALGNDVSYTELRMVANHLDYLANQHN